MYLICELILSISSLINAHSIEGLFLARDLEIRAEMNFGETRLAKQSL